MKRLIYVMAVAMFLALIALPAFSQEDKQAAASQPQTQAPTPAQPQVQAPTPAQPQAPAATMPSTAIPPAPSGEENAAAKELSIYGEVQAVNAGVNSITVQYYDYDSDEEKTIEITADKDTKIENAAALANIDKSDWVDVTYTLANGKNLAKSIMVEKEEKDDAKAAANTAAMPDTKPAEAPEE